MCAFVIRSIANKNPAGEIAERIVQPFYLFSVRAFMNEFGVLDAVQSLLLIKSTHSVLVIYDVFGSGDARVYYLLLLFDSIFMCGQLFVAALNYALTFEFINVLHISDNLRLLLFHFFFFLNLLSDHIFDFLHYSPMFFFASHSVAVRVD